jgi:hypothetical protein
MNLKSIISGCGNQATMMHLETTAHEMPGRVCAALTAIHGRVALVVGGEDRWRYDPGCVFIPAELPGGACPDDRSPETTVAAITAIGQRWFGCQLHLLPAEVTYGPSAKHAIDRLPRHGTPAPLLALERLAPADPDHQTGVRRVTVEVFRATTGEAGDTLEPQSTCAGLLLLSWRALRQMVRGLPLADLLARADVTLRMRPGVTLPTDALVYLTAEYGERALLRVTAKYGIQALGKDLDNGTGF